MKKKDGKIIWKILLTTLKVILAAPLALLFILVRCLQFFLKICGTVVSFVCILSAVVVSIGVLAEVFLQIEGKGPGFPAILLTLCIAGGLFYVPAAGVGMAMLVLEAVCSWIWKFYMGNSGKWKAFYKRPDYQWSAFDGDYRGKDTDNSEFKIHYFKGIKTREDLKKRYYALLRIYHPDNAFGEDEITRSIMEEYDYLKNKFPEKEEDPEEIKENEERPD